MNIALACALIASAQGGPVVDRLKAEAAALGSLAETPLAKAYLGAVNTLPEPQPRTIWQDPESKRFFADEKSAPAGSKAVEHDATFYYYTRYGSPLAYVRAIDLIGKLGIDSFQNRRVADFGYGGIGPLRLIANLGGHGVGIDIDSRLKALYSRREDTDKIMTRTTQGRITLVEGFFPSDPKTVREVGTGYDIFLSKNTLKRGYVHPEKEVDKRMLVDLGVTDLEFCQRVHELLKPKGLFVIYNLSPAQNPPDKPYIPWADGRCPFSRTDLERAGFEILSYDVVDDGTARQMGRHLGWDKGLTQEAYEKDLFAHYTIARRKS
ncbi:MAG TPA: hypothetical protein PLX06_04340 [Fimbriimonadaceae bacterium]|nr:hypothetical protein [Fimbriimonadaceae bacterium]